MLVACPWASASRPRSSASMALGKSIIETTSASEIQSGDSGMAKWESPALVGSLAGGGQHLAVPAPCQIQMNIELVEYPHDRLIDHLIDGLRTIIKRRHRRQDHHTHARELQHVLEMDVVEGRL